MSAEIEKYKRGVKSTEDYAESLKPLPLFDSAHVEIIPVAPARKSDPDTSHAAATGNLEIRGKDRIKALLSLYELGKATDFKLAEYTGVKQTSIGKRRHELTGKVKGKQVDPAYVIDSGEREPVCEGSSSKAIVWKLTPLGREVAERIKANG